LTGNHSKYLQNEVLLSQKQLKTSVRITVKESWCCTVNLYDPWNTYVGDGNPGQMRSFTWNHVSGSRRAFSSSVASCFVWLVIGAIAVIHALLDFTRERVRREFGSRWPDVVVGVR